MLYLFVYSVVVYAISNMFVYFNGPFNVVSRFVGWISKKNKTFEELFSCMFCLPVNIGMILSIISLIFYKFGPFTPFSIYFGDNLITLPLVVILDGFYSGGICYLIHTLQQFLEKNTKNE
jgi:hypothetical protein